jgi:hypothetical protein
VGEAAPDDWYSVRCLIAYRVRDDGWTSYEERITLWRAAGFDAAIELAEAEVAEHLSLLGVDEGCAVDFAQAYRLGDEAPDVSSEVYSLIRDSPLPRAQYVAQYFQTGHERTARAGPVTARWRTSGFARPAAPAGVPEGRLPDALETFQLRHNATLLLRRLGDLGVTSARYDPELAAAVFRRIDALDAGWVIPPPWRSVRGVDERVLGVWLRSVLDASFVTLRAAEVNEHGGSASAACVRVDGDVPTVALRWLAASGDVELLTADASVMVDVSEVDAPPGVEGPAYDAAVLHLA